MKRPTTPRPLDLIALFACLGTLSCWAVGPIFIKLLTGPLDGWTQNALRYTIGCLALLPWLAYQGRQQKLSPGLWRKALWPTIPNILMQSLWALGFYHADPGLLTLITKTNVLWIVAFSLWLFPDERVMLKRPGSWLGLALALTGVAGVALGDHEQHAGGSWLAFVIPMFSALFGGLYAVTVRASLRSVNSRQGFAVVSIYSMVSMWILTFIMGKPSSCLSMDLQGWFYVIFSGLTAIALGHSLYYVAIRRLGATIPSLFILAQPFFVLILSYFVFGEQFTGTQLAFGILLLIGAACAIWTQQKARQGQSA